MALRCDKCGKRLIQRGGGTDKDTTARIIYFGVGERRYEMSDGTRIDLCAECAEKFISWLENNAE